MIGSRRVARGWIGVDLDGTLARSDGRVGSIGDPVKPMVDRVKQWIANGQDVRIFTARVAASGKLNAIGKIDSIEFAESQRALIQDWTEMHIGHRLQVTATKDFAMLALWDDRAVRVKRNTGDVLSAIV